MGDSAKGSIVSDLLSRFAAKSPKQDHARSHDIKGDHARMGDWVVLLRIKKLTVPQQTHRCLACM